MELWEISTEKGLNSDPLLIAFVLPPTLAAQDLAGFLVSAWPAFVITFFLGVAILYLVAYVSRFFEYLKAQESRYLDRRTLDLTRKILVGTWIGLVVILILVSFAANISEMRGTVRAVVLHVPSILLVVFALTGSVIGVRAVTRHLSYRRGLLEEKPEAVLPSRSLATMEVIAKYSIYGLGVLVAILGGLGLLPPEDATIRQLIDDVIFAPLAPLLNPGYLTLLFTTVILLVIGLRLADSIFDDFKARTSKFTPLVIDLFRTFSKYALYGVAALAIIFLTLSTGLSADQLILIGLTLVLVALLAVLVLYDPIRNILSGIALINTDPFHEGDRVKVGESMVCDILEISLISTRVKTLKGEIVNFPNKELLSSPIMNFSRSKPYAMTVDVTVSFDVPHWKVESLLTDAARRTEGILSEPEPEVYARNLEGNTVSYQLWAYITDPGEMKRMRSELIAKAQELFHEEGFKLLFLQV